MKKASVVRLQNNYHSHSRAIGSSTIQNPITQMSSSMNNLHRNVSPGGAAQESHLSRSLPHRGAPSPKLSFHSPQKGSQKKFSTSEMGSPTEKVHVVPQLGRPEEHAVFLSVPLTDPQDANDITIDGEQQSIYSVREPQNHKQMAQLVAMQKQTVHASKHQQVDDSLRHHSTNNNSTAINANPAMNILLHEDKTQISFDATIASDDGVLSDRTVPVLQDGVHLTHNMVLSILQDKSLLSAWSDDVIATLYSRLLNEQHRREQRKNVSSSSSAAAAAFGTTGSAVSAPLAPTPLSSSSASAVPTNAPSSVSAAAAAVASLVIDQALVDSRKGLKRSKSGGSESAFAFNNNSRKAGVATSSATASAIPTSTAPSATGISSSSNSVGNSSKRVENLGFEHEDPEIRNAFDGSSSSSSMRVFSRSSGAYHPTDSMMVFGMRNSNSLACLSPQRHNHSSSTPSPHHTPSHSTSNHGHGHYAHGHVHGQGHNILNVSLDAQYASSSRPHSRNALASLANHQPVSVSMSEDDERERERDSQGSARGSFSLSVGGARSKLSPLEVHEMPVINSEPALSLVQETPLLQHQQEQQHHQEGELLLAGEGDAPAVTSALDYFITTNRIMAKTRDFVLSPFSAFDDLSVGTSQSLSSSISSKARQAKRSQQDGGKEVLPLQMSSPSRKKSSTKQMIIPTFVEGKTSKPINPTSTSSSSKKETHHSHQTHSPPKLSEPFLDGEDPFLTVVPATGGTLAAITANTMSSSSSSNDETGVILATGGATSLAGL